jgi:hypothetical protein
MDLLSYSVVDSVKIVDYVESIEAQPIEFLAY